MPGPFPEEDVTWRSEMEDDPDHESSTRGSPGTIRERFNLARGSGPAWDGCDDNSTR